MKRSFASVRAGLTEQRAQSVELARQMAAGMTKIDQLTVAHESAAAARVADQATMAAMMQRVNEIKEMLAAADDNDGDADDDEEEDPDAWVALVKVRFSLSLRATSLTAGPDTGVGRLPPLATVSRRVVSARQTLTAPTL